MHLSPAALESAVHLLDSPGFPSRRGDILERRLGTRESAGDRQLGSTRIASIAAFLHGVGLLVGKNIEAYVGHLYLLPGTVVMKTGK